MGASRRSAASPLSDLTLELLEDLRKDFDRSLKVGSEFLALLADLVDVRLRGLLLFLCGLDEKTSLLVGFGNDCLSFRTSVVEQTGIRHTVILLFSEFIP
jgi:hypothetical protein